MRMRNFLLLTLLTIACAAFSPPAAQGKEKDIGKYALVAEVAKAITVEATVSYADEKINFAKNKSLEVGCYEASTVNKVEVSSLAFLDRHRRLCSQGDINFTIYKSKFIASEPDQHISLHIDPGLMTSRKEKI